jgi:hypothetical protein
MCCCICAQPLILRTAQRPPFRLPHRLDRILLGGGASCHRPNNYCGQVSQGTPLPANALPFSSELLAASVCQNLHLTDSVFVGRMLPRLKAAVWRGAGMFSARRVHRIQTRCCHSLLKGEIIKTHSHTTKHDGCDSVKKLKINSGAIEDDMTIMDAI